MQHLNHQRLKMIDIRETFAILVFSNSSGYNCCSNWTVQIEVIAECLFIKGGTGWEMYQWPPTVSQLEATTMPPALRGINLTNGSVHILWTWLTAHAHLVPDFEVLPHHRCASALVPCCTAAPTSSVEHIIVPSRTASQTSLVTCCLHVLLWLPVPCSQIALFCNS